jgi:DUF1365 family protein
MTTAALLRSFFAFPMVTFKIIAAIHWEALRLWIKGVRYLPRQPKAPSNTVLAQVECSDYSQTAPSPQRGGRGA